MLNLLICCSIQNVTPGTKVKEQTGFSVVCILMMFSVDLLCFSVCILMMFSVDLLCFLYFDDVFC